MGSSCCRALRQMSELHAAMHSTWDYGHTGPRNMTTCNSLTLVIAKIGTEVLGGLVWHAIHSCPHIPCFTRQQQPRTCVALLLLAAICCTKACRGQTLHLNCSCIHLHTPTHNTLNCLPHCACLSAPCHSYVALIFLIGGTLQAITVHDEPRTRHLRHCQAMVHSRNMDRAGHP